MDKTASIYRPLPEDHDLTVQEVCAILRATAPTIYKLLNRGELKGYKVGASRRITRESLEALRSGKSAA